MPRRNQATIRPLEPDSVYRSRLVQQVISMPLVRRTRATLRRAEFGFLGVTVYTRVQTPRFCGAPRSAGVFVFAFGV